MLRALGPARYALFFERFIDAFFDDDDAAYLASLGLNHVRVPFNYRHFEDDDRPFELKASGFALLDRVVDICERNGLYAILDLHALPGCQNMDWHSNNPTHHAQFWVHRHFQDRVVHLWEALAERYKGRAAVAGYNLMNEPGDATGTRIKPFYDRVVAAVRAIDPDHVIFLDGNRYGTEFTAFENADVYPNTVYAAHDYKTPGMVFGGPYPGVTRGVYVDRANVEETFLRGPSSCAGRARRSGSASSDRSSPTSRRRTSRSTVSSPTSSTSTKRTARAGRSGPTRTSAAKASSTPSGLALDRTDPPGPRQEDPPRRRRLGLVNDASIRQVMAPIEEVFAASTPTSIPFPFGRTLDPDARAQHPARRADGGGLRRLLVGVADDEVIALAESFRFARCVRRERLAALLSASIAQAA